MNTTCPDTGKLSYNTLDEARGQISYDRKAHMKKKFPRKAYRCKSCGLWHLTSAKKNPKIKWNNPIIEVKEPMERKRSLYIIKQKY